MIFKSDYDKMVINKNVDPTINTKKSHFYSTACTNQVWKLTAHFFEVSHDYYF